MTGKRFTLSEDKYDETIFNNGIAMGIIDVVEKLNELHEKNHKLEVQLDTCLNTKLFSRRELEKENEQLKQQVHYLKVVCRNELDDETLKQVMGSLGELE